MYARYLGCESIRETHGFRGVGVLVDDSQLEYSWNLAEWCDADCSPWQFLGRTSGFLATVHWQALDQGQVGAARRAEVVCRSQLQVSFIHRTASAGRFTGRVAESHILPPCRSRELIDNKQKQLQPCKRQSSGAAERKTGSTFPSGLRNSSELQRGDICNAPTEFSSMKTLGTHLSSNYPATGR